MNDVPNVIFSRLLVADCCGQERFLELLCPLVVIQRLGLDTTSLAHQQAATRLQWNPFERVIG